MGDISNEISNKAEELKGGVKEHVGDATDDEDLEAEGMADKAKANAKQAGEDVKDAAESMRDALDR